MSSQAAFLILVIVACCSPFCNGIAAPTPYAMPGEAAPNDNGELDLAMITQKCNETFRIQMDYLKELNETGAFPDETDKTPMCFIKCYLENIGIWQKDGTIDKERAQTMLWAETDDDIVECLPDMIGNTDCEKAYYLARCVLTRALVDGRGETSSK